MEHMARARAEIDLDNLRHNYKMIRQAIGHSRYMAVVKADAYGHGASVVAPVLEELGVDWFGVASLEEALQLREAGVRRPVLIFGWADPRCAPQLAAAGIAQTVYSREYASALAEEAGKAGVTVEVHLKVDSGMGRLGFDPRRGEELEGLLAAARNPRFHVTGIFTHFAVADEPETEKSVEFTRRQFKRYEEACAFLASHGAEVGLRHCCNSAAGLLFPEMRLDMVRMGICTYGMEPSGQMAGTADLKPVMALKSVVSMVKTIHSGDTVSYGRIYTAQEERKIATIPVGYADGYLRALGGLADVLIRGQRAPVVGRVCMDQMMADVTGIPGVAMGDTVTLAGTDGGEQITMEELADLTDTISYEKICGLTQRVVRVYLNR